ncbi:cobalt-precorrin-6A reductase [Psychromarinibacter sp. C21-152]|uniref:Cobalt-precorrin-6A reductase n=1 Tax=Psychromarinibacter sediminicola TaxID=3033385 RepID=A0AAE3NV80_9RHOB|nr:cobalt-precorrin-6A reductase [Psychromarinibacter sediminicola]MDF0602641.1 cobalt-precorrin-6A reductase [Psychromarinibacter sediminicola]
MRLLLLAGTAEARQVAGRIAGMRGVTALASLNGDTSHPAQLKLPTRIGGFGGRAGFELYLRRHSIDAVLDATHPFAVNITRRTAEVCAETGVAYAQLLRPEWEPGPGDAWTCADREEAVADLIPEGATVFLATGPKGIGRFHGLAGRRILCRRIDQARGAFPFKGGDWIVARPPFTVADEIALFRAHAVDWLVARNSGGGAGRAKLDAAREMGLNVAMIRRPAQPDVLRVPDPEAAVAWVRDLR